MSANEHDQIKTLAAISAWLEALGALCAGNFSADAARAKVDAYAPMLALRYSVSVLDAWLLEYVAARCKFWPSYGELVSLIEGCPFYYRPSRQELTAPGGMPGSPISAEERASVAARMAALARDMAGRLSAPASRSGIALGDVTLKGAALEAVRRGCQSQKLTGFAGSDASPRVVRDIAN